MKVAEQVYAYVGICSHGKVRAITVDEPEYAKETRKDVAEFMRGGLTIERWTIEATRSAEFLCDICSARMLVSKRGKRQ